MARMLHGPPPPTPMLRRPVLPLIALAILCPGIVPAAPAPAKLSFNTHVQPLLSEYCYHCHGPDSGTRKPKDHPLRLDRAADAFLPREDGKPAIIKGDAGGSSVVQRMLATKADEIMPPPESHKKMKAEEIAVIKQWIAEGAVYEDHWSFIAPRQPAVPVLPASAPAEWKATPLDAYVFQQMTAAGLSPNPPEERARLLRRVTFDLTGLPPTPEEINTFLADTSPDAYEKSVTRLLASPRYGEHMARHWLDAARYADTHGVHIDNYRSIWPYRDWVINAFNTNMPFDRFTVEQIAGDMLPEASIDQQIATGFHRCMPTTGEGGAIAEEYDAIYAKDRVDTTSGVWLGLGMGCASCHDHKFDPLTMKDFYSFAAFFRNTPMTALDGNKADHPPNMLVPSPADRPRLLALQGELSAARAALTARQSAARPDFDKWLASPPSPGPDHTNLHVHLPLATASEEITGTIDGTARTWKGKFGRADGPFGPAPVIKDGADLVIGDAGDFDRMDSLSYGAMIKTDGSPSGAVIARMDPKSAHRGWDLWLQDGHAGAHVIHQWPDNATKIVSKRKLSPGQWHHVMVVFDGSKPAAECLALYVNGQPEPFNIEKNTLTGSPRTPVPLRIGRRDPGAGADDSIRGGQVAVQDVRILRRVLTPAEIASFAGDTMRIAWQTSPPDQHAAPRADAIFRWYLDRFDDPSRVLRATVATMEAEDQAIRQRGTITLVMKEKDGSKPSARILDRGVYSSPGETVPANVPAALPAFTSEQPANRLGLARWLVDPRNPLTARVTVNRLWHQIFGTGIVETTEDFGIMGARPSHPELLDHLALEFTASGWDIKHLMHTLVTSAAYRQSATCTPAQLDKDPRNRLLSRGPRLRLDAEPLRDMALAASGLMIGDIGGPSVKPYQPEGVWEAVAMKESNTRNYKADGGPANYRRSLYTFWKRTAPHPSMETLNAPARETFCTRRERTNTPLQALVLMNDPQFVECARVLAERTLGETKETRARLDLLGLRLLARPLTDPEATVLTTSLAAFKEDFTAEPNAATSLIKVGNSIAKHTDTAELAAWTLVASQIMNMDECLTR